MSTPANSQSLLAPAGTTAGFATPASGSAPPAVALATPSQAVESVLQIADIQAAQAQSSPAAVNLHFTVGGENLSVRVALQDGQVHTQFTTDSSMLRTALAHEWQAVSAGTPGTVRFAEPVFTSGQRSDSKSGADLTGQGGNQANRGREQAEFSNGGQASNKPARLTPAVLPMADLPASSEPVVLGRLHSFA